MTDQPSIRFASLQTPPKGTIAILVGADTALSAKGQSLDKASHGQLARACKAGRFTGAVKSTTEVLVPSGIDADRVLLIGIGEAAGDTAEWTEIGGYAMGQIASRRISAAGLLAEAAGAPLPAAAIADLALGMLLRAYSFAKYKTRSKGNGSEGKAADKPAEITIHCGDPDEASAAFRVRKALADGVYLARDLVNEPANELGPVEFAERVKGLQELGVEVEILDEHRLAEIGMRTLLGVAQGSTRPARVAVMQWHGSKGKRGKPIAIVGKGVVFDTGGISMKPAKGMEDMKGDMGGAACVAGLMHALAARKAPVNAIGVIGLVENMPSGNAQRPGDIIRSLSGQTVEILNTDAEGRLVLADVLWYVQDRFKPKAMIDLATLTGAIMVALGKEYAGLFSNDDRLAGWLMEAGKATGEKVWRMPIDPAYDKDIDSKNADMKNIGGQYGGSCTAAAFLARFVRDNTPWAHLDIAGTAMGSSRSEVNESWGSGFGVRLLDRLIAEHYEG